MWFSAYFLYFEMAHLLFFFCYCSVDGYNGWKIGSCIHVKEKSKV
jgi:hypothetical protein